MPSMKKNDEEGVMEGILNKLLKGIGDPVDFELPEWLIKWKPAAYKFIKRNIYLTKKNKRRLEDDVIFCSCSSSTGSFGVCERDCLCRFYCQCLMNYKEVKMVTMWLLEGLHQLLLEKASPPLLLASVRHWEHFLIKSDSSYLNQWEKKKKEKIEC